jgi:choline kinase
MHLILLAAGKGSRLQRKYRLEPKCAVKICGKTLLEHNINFYKKFRNKTIVTGYKSKKLNLFIKKNKFKNIKNKNYSNTNMVYSLFKVESIKSNNIIVCYSDIIFDENIYSNLKKNYSNTIILLKKNRIKIWRGRMKYNKIKDDAENVKIKNNYLISIGEKITNKFPKYQYMGIIKLKKKDFFKLKKFFKKIKNTKIDFTSFLNRAIKSKIIKVNVIITSKFWYEIDNIADIKFTEKDLW